MKTIRWGILGCGDVTEVKSGPGFSRAENSSLVAVMRRNGELAKAYAERNNVPHWYDDADKLINDPDVDAVYIATRPDSHKEYVLKCAAAGKPVLVEKPVARTYDEAKAMIEACKSAKVPLWVAFYRRAMPLFLKVKELVDSGAIGTVRYVVVHHQEATPVEGFEKLPASWRYVPAIGGGGVFVDIGSHVFDFLDYVLGPIREVRGIATNQAGLYAAEDMVTACFGFEGGVQGSGTWNFVAYDNYERTWIVGDKGELSFSFYAPNPIELKTQEGKQTFDVGFPKHVHQPLIQTIVNEMNGVGVCASTGESGIRATWVMDQVLADYRAVNGIRIP